MCSAENNKGSYAKVSEKSLRQQIDVVAEFHAYKIHPQRIAYRTGIEMDLVTELISGDCHQRLFKSLVARHRKSRRDQRLQKAFRKKGIAQAELQDKIEQEYEASIRMKAEMT
ncbi:MAG: hypothetical protein GY712_11040 [Oceanicoccus sp.]|uniref:hypothetical protein n=1 Tax=Oceanicoccus sp. TaxID=2691044 RepID=UPI0026366BDB|nr:hypothetical protein [Oceanicoccus sp.]MCP3908538.1 hypothetical protein [Oceanicoccus sp.]MDG1773227.1 hypothetical protein [Oceanicoccus sp.]